MAIEAVRSSAVQYSPAITRPAQAGFQNAVTQSEETTKVPFISPAIQYDSDAGIAVVLFRNADTGVVENQLPSKEVVRKYQLRSPGSPRGEQAVEPAPDNKDAAGLNKGRGARAGADAVGAVGDSGKGVGTGAGTGTGTVVSAGASGFSVGSSAAGGTGAVAAAVSVAAAGSTGGVSLVA